MFICFVVLKFRTCSFELIPITHVDTRLQAVVIILKPLYAEQVNLELGSFMSSSPIAQCHMGNRSTQRLHHPGIKMMGRRFLLYPAVLCLYYSVALVSVYNKLLLVAQNPSLPFCVVWFVVRRQTFPVRCCSGGSRRMAWVSWYAVSSLRVALLYHVITVHLVTV